jgi:hypothetical protein
MSKLRFAILISLILSAPMALAADQPPPGPKGPSAEAMDKQMRMMQENMIKMHEQMHKIMDTKDPQERERLMAEQRKMMGEQMMRMHGGMGGGMMGPGMMGGPGKSGASDKPTGK